MHWETEGKLLHKLERTKNVLNEMKTTEAVIKKT